MVFHRTAKTVVEAHLDGAPDSWFDAGPVAAGEVDAHDPAPYRAANLGDLGPEVDETLHGAVGEL